MEDLKKQELTLRGHQTSVERIEDVLADFGKMSIFAAEAISAYEAAQKSDTGKAVYEEEEMPSFSSIEDLEKTLGSPEWSDAIGLLLEMEGAINAEASRIPKAKRTAVNVLKAVFSGQEPKYMRQMLEAIKLNPNGFSEETSALFIQILNAYKSGNSYFNLSEGITWSLRTLSVSNAYDKALFQLDGNKRVTGVLIPIGGRRSFFQLYEDVINTGGKEYFGKHPHNHSVLREYSGSVSYLMSTNEAVEALAKGIFGDIDPDSAELGPEAIVETASDLYTAIIRARTIGRKTHLERNNMTDFEDFQLMWPNLSAHPLLREELKRVFQISFKDAEETKPGSGRHRFVGELLDEEVLDSCESELEKEKKKDTSSGAWWHFWRSQESPKLIEDKGHAKSADETVTAFFEGYRLALFFRHFGEQLAQTAKDYPEHHDQAKKYLALARGISEELARQAPLIEIHLKMKEMGEDFGLSSIVDGVSALGVLRENPADKLAERAINKMIDKVSAAKEVDGL